jgi:hypothetical protein
LACWGAFSVGSRVRGKPTSQSTTGHDVGNPRALDPTRWSTGSKEPKFSCRDGVVHQFVPATISIAALLGGFVIAGASLTTLMLLGGATAAVTVCLVVGAAKLTTLET